MDCGAPHIRIDPLPRAAQSALRWTVFGTAMQVVSYISDASAARNPLRCAIRAAPRGSYLPSPERYDNNWNRIDRWFVTNTFIGRSSLFVIGTVPAGPQPAT